MINDIIDNLKFLTSFVKATSTDATDTLIAIDANGQVKFIPNNVLAAYIATAIGSSNEKGNLETLVLGDNDITFPGSAYADTNWYFTSIPLCYDNAGNIVTPNITNRTASGFTVNIGSAGTIEYLTKHN